MPINHKGRTEFKKQEIKEAIDGLKAMLDCAIERDDKKDQRVLDVALGAVTFILGDGTADCSVKGWPQ